MIVISLLEDILDNCISWLIDKIIEQNVKIRWLAETVFTQEHLF